MKLLNLDLELPLPDLPRPTAGAQWVLIRLHGQPLGLLRLQDRAHTAAELRHLAVSQLAPSVAAHLAADGLHGGVVGMLLDDLASLPRSCPQQLRGAVWPIVTVAVCTRDGAARLDECLGSIEALDYPADRLDVIVVDNAPSDADTKRLVSRRYRRFRYVEEPRPGLDWARNRAVLESRGEIVAFTDDDVSVDRGWVRALATTFLCEPEAAAITGLVVPDEIDVPAQSLFEDYGGFGRGFRRRYFQVNAAGGESAGGSHGGAGKFGTGANMAFRRSLFESAGGFDPALDVGTPANGGGDLEMFYRVLKAGHLLVYEPAAVVRHRHRRDYAALRAQLANNGIGFYAYLAHGAREHRDDRWAFRWLALWWFWRWNVRRLLIACVRRNWFPRDLILAELRGSLAGPRRYRLARRQAADVVRRFGAHPPLQRVGQAVSGGAPLPPATRNGRAP